MAYLLELLQADQRVTVGVFGSQADALSMVLRFPGLHENADHPGLYWLEPTEIPELTEIDHAGWVFPLCRASFYTYPSDGIIHVVWNEVQIFDGHPPTAGSYAAGSLPLNGYSFDMADVPAHVRARELLFEEAQTHFAERGQVAGARPSVPRTGSTWRWRRSTPTSPGICSSCSTLRPSTSARRAGASRTS